jgi:lipopolysaccharide/colanic/teichoic acid biosynthesis glycosyltransferase
MSAHLNEAALEHAHAAPAEVFPQGFAFPSQTEALVARAAHLETVPAAEAVVDEVAEVEVEQPAAVEPAVAIPIFSRQALILKRTLDVALALVCFVCAVPMFLIVGLLVALTSRGPVLFKQQRVGKNGVLFSMLKFRTMHSDTEHRLRRDPELWALYVLNDYKLPGTHSQVTSVGSTLRKFSLDELPQLWNVLRGDMSMVGVRPVTKEQFDSRPQPTRHLYVALRPGVTGLWQVRGRSSIQHGSRLALDDRYTSTWSNRQDLSILVRTPVAVLKPSQTR